MRKFKETGDSQYIYQNKLDKACFQHDMSYGDFKDLTRRTASDKILRDKVFDVANNPKYDGYQRGFVSIVYKCFDKKTAGGAVEKENMSSQRPLDLAKQLHKPFIRKFEKPGVYSSFIDNIWGADLTDIKLINKFNKGIRFLFLLLIFSVNTHSLFL